MKRSWLATTAATALCVGCGRAAPPPVVTQGPLQGAPIDGPPTPAPVPATAPAPPRDPAPDSGPLPIGFPVLAEWPVPRVSMPRELPDAPKALQALHGKRVTIAGYVIPDQTGDGGRLETALFIKHLLACCFGQMPKLNEWVHLEIAADAEIEFNWRRPARIEGTFLVGPHKAGEVAQALYRIRVTSIQEDLEYRG